MTKNGNDSPRLWFVGIEGAPPEYGRIVAAPDPKSAAIEARPLLTSGNHALTVRPDNVAAKEYCLELAIEAPIVISITRQWHVEVPGRNDGGVEIEAIDPYDAALTARRSFYPHHANPFWVWANNDMARDYLRERNYDPKEKVVAG